MNVKSAPSAVGYPLAGMSVLAPRWINVAEVDQRLPRPY
jgi:hypothetical protein